LRLTPKCSLDLFSGHVRLSYDFDTLDSVDKAIDRENQARP
ncbi:MAG: hypothetical protein RLZZ568_1932, partial [Cyanobacteriota bacterium]